MSRALPYKVCQYGKSLLPEAGLYARLSLQTIDFYLIVMARPSEPSKTEGLA
jgi:hypothetical protein